MEDDSRLVSNIEAIFVFSLVWGAGSNIKNEKRWMF